jgi:hypothetical protein
MTELRTVNRIINLLVLAATVAISLVIGEVAARLVLPSSDYLRMYMIEDELFGSMIRPNSPGHDAWGFRNPVVPSRAEIVAIGDSLTYGYGAGREGTWPAQLQEISGRSVYNLGLGGFGPVQYFLLLREKALTLSPSIVVVGFYYGNDLMNAYQTIGSGTAVRELIKEKAIEFVEPEEVAYLLLSGFSGPGTGENPDAACRGCERGGIVQTGFLDRATRPLRDWLGRNSLIYRLAGEMKRKFTCYLQFKGLIPPPKDYAAVGSNPELPGGTAVSPFRRLEGMNLEDPRVRAGMTISLGCISAMKELCLRNKVRFLVILIPSKARVMADHLRKSSPPEIRGIIDKIVDNECKIDTRVKCYCRDQGITYLDILPLFQNAAKKEPIYPWFQDGHPNRSGYRIIAEALKRDISATEFQ